MNKGMGLKSIMTIKVTSVVFHSKNKRLTEKMVEAIKKQWPEVIRVVSGGSIGFGVFRAIVHVTGE